MSKISLPNNLKLVDSSAGIKQESKGTLKVITKTARLAETALKQISILPLQQKADSSFKISSKDLANLYTISAAQIQFLQSEYASLVVKITFYIIGSALCLISI